MQEKCSFVPVLQGSAWTGSCPHELTVAPDKVYWILQNWYIYCSVSHIDAYMFSVSCKDDDDWNAVPDSTRTKQSVDSFKKALHKLSDNSADWCWAVPIQQ